MLALGACELQPPRPEDEPGTDAPEEAAAEASEAEAESVPEPPAESDLPEVFVLLDLATEVIESATPEQRRVLRETQRERYEADPSYDNLLRYTVVRAFSAALPSELQEVRSDLQAMANGREEFTDDQRRIALIALIMVDERLRLGEQILSLQKQIDRLTEIEASLNIQGGNGQSEKSN